jgi:hypothetical protein
VPAKDEIESIVQWLEGTDEDQWPDQLDLAAEIIAELRLRARGAVRRDKTESRSAQTPTFNEESENASSAIQQVNAMIVAMKRRDRKLAVAYGRAAIAWL